MAEAIRRWLRIAPPYYTRWPDIRATTDHDLEVARNRIWYRGDADELLQFYSRLSSDAGSSRFWASVPPGRKIRKIHSGLPGMMVDTLVGVVCGDFDGIDFAGGDDGALPPGKARWEEIDRTLCLPDHLAAWLTEAAVTGDGVAKIAWDISVSDTPIVICYGGDRVRYHQRNGLTTAISVYTDYPVGDTVCQLEEICSPGHIRSVLRDDRGNTVPFGRVPALAGTQAEIQLPDGVMAAVPLVLFRGGRWPEYGRSLIAGKTDVFDALDEVISQWMDAIRSGRVQRYIPEDMMPRDPRNGRVYLPDSFGADFIQLAQNTNEDAASKMEVVQPDIRYDAFLASYSATLDMCLQGILSPATLGIDIGKLSSGEAQRERKDITGFTRNSITAVLERVLPQLVTAILQIDDWIHRRPIGRYTPSVSFGEYASPDFASRAKAVREAAAGGAMSIEAQIEELWGGSKDDEWISAEIKRVKAERGITETDPPGAGDDLP